MSTTPALTRANFLATGIQPASQPTDECGICLEPLAQDGVRTVACSHCFHLSCITQWTAGNVGTNHTCPLCRRELFRIPRTHISAGPNTRALNSAMAMGRLGYRRREDYETGLPSRSGMIRRSSDPPLGHEESWNYERFMGSIAADRTAPEVNEGYRNADFNRFVHDLGFSAPRRARPEAGEPSHPVPHSRGAPQVSQSPDNPSAWNMEDQNAVSRRYNEEVRALIENFRRTRFLPYRPRSPTPFSAGSPTLESHEDHHIAESRRRIEEMRAEAEDNARIHRRHPSQHPPGSAASSDPYVPTRASSRTRLSGLQRRAEEMILRGEAHLRSRRGIYAERPRESTATPILEPATSESIDALLSELERSNEEWRASNDIFMGWRRIRPSQHPQEPTASRPTVLQAFEGRLARLAEDQTRASGLPIEESRAFFPGLRETSPVRRALPSQHQSRDRDREHASHTPPTPIDSSWPASLRDALPRPHDTPDQSQPPRTPVTSDHYNTKVESTTPPGSPAPTMSLNLNSAPQQHNRARFDVPSVPRPLHERRASQSIDHLSPFNYQQFGRQASDRRGGWTYTLPDPLPPLGHTSRESLLDRQQARDDFLRRESQEDAELERLAQRRGL